MSESHGENPKMNLGRGPRAWALRLVLIASAALAYMFFGGAPQPQPLPVMGVVPAFEYTNQDGESFGTRQLGETVWVANFIFTRCNTVCPVFTGEMYKVQQRVEDMGDKIHLVSFSVDPEYDTPEVLKQYAAEHGVNTQNWSFLTGPIDQVKNTVVTGMKIMLSERGDPEDVQGLLHGSHFVVVDALQQVRGYYDANDQDAVEQMLLDLKSLVSMTGE